MAMIKCPECGHQISDKAPVCPNCGVEIAGKIVRCPNCGEVYFANEEMCPNCHCPTKADGAAQPMSAPHPITTGEKQTAVARPSTPPVPPIPSHSGKGNTGSVPPGKNDNGSGKGHSGKKRHYGPLIAGLIVALIAVGLMFHFYVNAQNSKEEEAYEYAMQSTDPTVLQSYLETYRDAPEAHIDSIQNHLSLLKQNDQEWTNVLMSGSKTALEDYLKKYPNSPHAKEAQEKIDSLDWNEAVNENTAESFQAYVDAHPNGAFMDEAQENIKKLRMKELQPEEKQMISSLFRTFFQSVNSKNEDRLTDQVEEVMSSFLGKSSATKSDVVSFLHKLWKEDVKNMNWKINNDYNIKKREVGDNEYEYEVQFSAHQDIEHTDATTEEGRYRIRATVSPDGKISAFNMVRILM